MINEHSTDLELFDDFGLEIEGFEQTAKHRGIAIWRLPRKMSADARQYYTYYAAIRFKDSYSVLKSVTLSGIKSQIGRIRNGLEPHDCSICVYHIPRTPIDPDYCHWTIDPELTGFYGCPRFDLR